MVAVQLMELLKTLYQLIDQKPKFVLRKLSLLLHQLKEVSILHKSHRIVAVLSSILILPLELKLQNMSNSQLLRSLESQINKNVNFSQKVLQSRGEKLPSKGLHCNQILTIKVIAEKHLAEPTSPELMQKPIPPINDPSLANRFGEFSEQSLLDHFKLN